MKRLRIVLLLSVVVSVSTVMYAGTPINSSALPKSVNTFLSKYFPGDVVIKAEKEQDYLGLEYDVDLKSGAEASFRENGVWKEIKVARGKSVPASLIPVAISKYVTSNYPGQKIVEISRKRGSYEIDLSNGKELKLTEDAKPATANPSGRPRNK